MKALTLLFFAATVVAQTPESAVLGGPCEVEDDNDLDQIVSWHSRVNAVAQAEWRSHLDLAAEAAKKVVRGRCSNEYWWLRLAELQAKLGREQETVSVLEALYLRRSNAVDRRLRDPKSPLHSLTRTEAYQRSALAASLAEDRRALAERREQARARLAALPHRMQMQSWIAKGACPFECCHYGSWSVHQDLSLYDSPNGSNIVGQAMQDRQVEALTGEVHLRPLPVRVRYGSLGQYTVEEGAIVYLLDYLGEGHGRVFVDGKIVSTGVDSVYEHCAFAGSECWGEFVDPDDAGRQRDGIWWVKIRTADGVVGWTREVEEFGGAGACG